MKIIKIFRMRFPYSGDVLYAFSQGKSDSIRALFTANHGDPVVDIILVPVDPYIPVDTALDPSGLVENLKGVTHPSVGTDGTITDPQAWLLRWKSAGWNGEIEEVTEP